MVTQAANVTPALNDLVHAYLEAFEARDMPTCLGYFGEEARVTFQSSVYRGLPAIERWHHDRFGANLRVIRVDNVRVDGQVVTAEAVVVSNRLKAWKIDALPITVTLGFVDGKINDVDFSLRLSSW